ncbi:hypothetical protein [aff. Roholtiella sp. LEGE 12411]|uniref:hypothetical protein n=1 Tax=aff. Roholtiella sp. LEGE 12411 TaxID=1828822 RepID=UPI0030D91526
MKAYSIDLRRKITETYEQESISQRKLAERFRVAPSFIYKLFIIGLLIVATVSRSQTFRNSRNNEGFSPK